MMARFHAGLPPEDAESTAGWTALREPQAKDITRVSLPIAVALFGSALACWHGMGVSVLAALQVRGMADALQLGAGFVLLLIVHELVHLLFHPGCGSSRSSVLGASWRPLLLYAHFEGPLSQRRFMAILLAPFAVLSVVPLLAYLAGLVPAQAGAAVAAASAVNAAAASVDVLGAFLVARQVPRDGVVRNNGWKTYWRRRSD